MTEPGQITDRWGTWTHLGHDVHVAPITVPDGTVVGLLERHPCRDARGRIAPTVATLPFLGPHWPHAFGRWRLRSLDPLTITPTVLCRTCGRHGQISYGEWVPCADDRNVWPPPRDPHKVIRSGKHPNSRANLELGRGRTRRAIAMGDIPAEWHTRNPVSRLP